MTPDEGIAFWRGTPLAVVSVRFAQKDLVGRCFDRSEESNADDVWTLNYCTEADITPIHISVDGGRCYADTLMDDNPDPTFVTAPAKWKAWKALADECLHPSEFQVPGYNFEYDEAFGRCCAELWAAAPTSMFKDDVSRERVRAFIVGLAPRKETTAMRTMYDSTSAADIPTSATMVAGYVDGAYAWSAADWARFPDAIKVRISVMGNDADVLDVEAGAATPGMAPDWADRQRARGADPTVYVNLANVAAVRGAFDATGDPQPHYWLAHYDGVAQVPAGYDAKQYADEALTGGHYDVSAVADGWPRVEGGTVDDTEFLEKYNRLIQPGVTATDNAIKDRLAIDAHHKHTLIQPNAVTSEPNP